MAAIYRPTYNFEFASRSRLSEGRWVKIRVAESGVYEISYDRLAEMGFENPAAVGVYGNGGREIDLSFLSSSGKNLFRDDLQPVAVYHSDGKLYFYATGVEHISFDGAKFVRHSFNQYSRDGIYFLSDSETPLEMERGMAGEEGIERSDLWDYLYHEVDLTHGSRHFGRFYWGEDLCKQPLQEFPLLLPFIDLHTSGRSDKARFDYTLAIGPKDTIGSLEISVGSFSDSHSTNKQTGKTYSYSVRNLDPASLPGSKARFRYEPGGTGYMAIDYWLLTYPKRLPFEEEKESFIQERLYLHNSSVDDLNGYIRVPSGSVVFDVTDPWTPVVLPVEGDKAMMSLPGKARELVAFDPSRPQKRIKTGFEKVEPQNLHSYRAEGCDLLILTIEKMLPYARRIAELHRRYDGLRVVVATPKEVYNEFSSGMPDPMAYRAFAKMLHTGPGRSCKNVLFIGPMRNDFRQISSGFDIEEAFVAFPALISSNFDSPDSETPSVMDFAGYAGDDLAPDSKMEESVLDMGVGFLPISTDRQGELALSKIEEYMRMLANGEMAAIANRTLSIGCPGNSHGHNRQAITYGEFTQAYVKATSKARFPHQTLLISDYSKPEANLLFRDLMEEGMLYSIYYGHAGSAGLTERFWQTQDFINLRNRYLGFMFMAGCDLSLVDLGMTGIGDLSVTEAPRGLIGCVASTRTVWSQQNETLAKEFLSAMFLDDSGLPRSVSPTIGEVYAQSKTKTVNNNSMSFYYIGDPALRFPLAVRRATASVADRPFAEEEVVTVTGELLLPFGSDRDLAARGKVMVRVCRPVATHLNLEPAENGNSLGGEYNAIRTDDNGIDIVTATGEVADGKYSVRLRLPAEVADYRTLPSDTVARLPVYVSIYDPDNRSAYSAYTTIALQHLGAPMLPDAEFDDAAPEVAVTYDDVMGLIRVSASDNVGFCPRMNPGGDIQATLDGDAFIQDASAWGNPDMTSDWKAVFPMLRLREGDHRFTLRVTDCAGNVSPLAICNFNVGKAPLLRLEQISSVALDEVRFSVDGASADNHLRLRVVDSDNKEKYDGEAGAMETACSTEGWQPGVYRAAIYEEGPSGGRRHSEWISFSVVR